MIRVFCAFWQSMLWSVLGLQAQFDLELKPVELSGLGGLQSYSVGQHGGKWLLVGGRLDGLHRRQPFASFDSAGHNRNLILVDVQAGTVRSRSLSELPQAVREQLSSSNMAFWQQGDYLYCAGGYGQSAAAGDHKTFDQLTAIRLPSVISAIENDNPFAEGDFRQIQDEQFAVAGGRMLRLYDTYFLVGGHRFDGLYNPINGPSFTQTYTCQVRRFRLHDNPLRAEWLPAWTDKALLHRRDYNLVPQVLPDGRLGATAFSGVFQTTANIPYLHCVHIDASGYAPQSGFAQYYNHYHCAFVPLYSAKNREMHTLFFGGIAQYYDENGALVQDNDVPFVRTVSRVVRRADGSMSEYKLPVEMPELLGAGSEFIPIEGLPRYDNGVLRLDDLPADEQGGVLLGYIFGGIRSTAPLIFWTHEGQESQADRRLFALYLKTNSNTQHQLNAHSNNGLQLHVYPNPNHGIVQIDFNAPSKAAVDLAFYDLNGGLLQAEKQKQVQPGRNIWTRRLAGMEQGGVYWLELKAGKVKARQKIVVHAE